MVNTKVDISTVVGAALRKHQQRDFAGAEVLYQQILAHDPNQADALHLYGCLCNDLGRLDDAIAYISRATQCNPQAYPYFYNLANMLSKQGRLSDAVLQYRTAVKLKPDYAAAHNNLGLVLRKQMDHAGAKKCFQTAILSRANYADPHYNLGIEFKDEGNIVAAIEQYQIAIRLQPDYADAYYNLGNAYSKTQDLDKSLEAYQMAHQLQPNNPKVLTNMGNVLLKLARLSDARASFETALKLDPEDVLNHSNLILVSSYATDDPSAMYAECERWQKAHGDRLPVERIKHRNDCTPDRPLRIGYVSHDFRRHAAAYWIEPLLAGHQNNHAVEVYGYSTNKESDDVTSRLQALTKQWRNCALLDDDAMALLIQSDCIDILVDLSGHTEGNRLTVFARKPAPIQISWFGFPVSTGLQTIDYRFTDAILDPVGVNDEYYSETLHRLPYFYAPYLPDPNALPLGEGPFERNGYVTFASFNTFTKISESMIGIWCELMRAVPNSRLLFQSAGLDNPVIAKTVMDVFARNGLADSTRVELRGWSDLKSYLALGMQADIALDTFPFNGGVTTCHASWMGLPVVTMSGRSAASRVGKSLLTRMGLEHLVAGTPAQYVAAAVALATDRQALKQLRATLRDKMVFGGLLNGAAIAVEVEAAYREMWKKWCNSQHQ